MFEYYGGYIIFSNPTNERLDKMIFAPTQKKLYNSYLPQNDPCGRIIVGNDWFEKPLTDRRGLELEILSCIKKAKGKCLPFQTQ